MKVGNALVVALFLISCGNEPTASAPTPNRPGMPTATTTASPGPASSSRTSATVSPASAPPQISPAPIANSLNCRLPITWSDKAGYLRFPEGQVSEDPSAPSGSQFFDAAYSRWLPVAREAVSASGAQYAYTDGSTYQGIEGHVHIVDVSTNADHVVYSGKVYRVVDFASEGIYLTEDTGDGPNTGFWLLNLSGGSPRLINSSIWTPSVGGGSGWGGGFNPADPSPPPGGMAGTPNLIDRIDLSNETATPWFYTQGAQPTVLGFDRSGDPFVRVDRMAPNDPDVQHGTNELWIVTSPNTGSRLLSGVGWNEGPWRLAAIDSHGVWFDGSDGIWLYSQGAVQLVAKPGVGQLSVAVAGGCLKN